MKKELSHRTEIQVKFSEVDSMKVVWHGHYIRYMEDAREAFGLKYGFHYLDAYKNNYYLPIVKSSVDYKQSITYGDTLIVEATFINHAASKIHFKYKMYSKEKDILIAEGETIQVFTSMEGELQLTNPPYFDTWKKSHDLA